MNKITIGIIFLIFLSAIFYNASSVHASGLNQQPTISLPTVTGTPPGVIAKVNQDVEFVNVRSGPSTLYKEVGILLTAQEVPVIGRSKGGEWLYITYVGAPNNVGWVYEPYFTRSPGELQIIELPPTPSPAVTQTINPTLAAQFISTPNPTRLPTFTPGEPLVVPAYKDVSRTSFLGGIPMGLVILIIGGLGGLLALFSFIRAR
ncbi:MAG TPA: SH3 domain-containing protein [Pelolinea sp.]|nr:SH3 domain-containing protein [Pelolinea sp.]